MSVKSDAWIRKMAKKEKMISPFSDKQVRKNVISYGLSSYGYDIRVADEFKLLSSKINQTLIDPKNFDESNYIKFKKDHCIIPPNSIVLARTVEYFKIPGNIMKFKVCEI